MAQVSPQMLEWKTSLHDWPMAFSLDQPVIFSAARLKEVIFQLRSTVNTPSATLSSTRSCWMLRVWSLKVTTPPMILLSGSTSGVLVMAHGIGLPFFPLTNRDWVVMEASFFTPSIVVVLILSEFGRI